jgi:chloramphenicol O-acetyltransferase
MNEQQPQQSTQPKQRLVDVPVTDQTSALNVMVSYLALAQKRGVFTLEEAAHIMKCINVFSGDSTSQEE